MRENVGLCTRVCSLFRVFVCFFLFDCLCACSVCLSVCLCVSACVICVHVFVRVVKMSVSYVIGCLMCFSVSVCAMCFVSV